MGGLLGNILLSILAILLPPIAAFLKVNSLSHISSEQINLTESVFCILGGLLETILD